MDQLQHVGTAEVVMIVDSGVRFEWNSHRGLFNWIKVNKHQVAAVDWCHENFGQSGTDNWWYSKNRFYFTKHDDMTLFLLRWS